MLAQEAAARLPLRWGGYRSRLAGGLALAAGGGTLVAGSDTFQLGLLGLAQLALTIGWAVLPGAGWRRITALPLASLGCWLLLGGPKLLPAALLPYLAWLLVRHRPALAWLSALVPLGAILAQMTLLPRDYAVMLPELGMTAASLVGGAWLAAGVDLALRRARGPLSAPLDTI